MMQHQLKQLGSNEAEDSSYDSDECEHDRTPYRSNTKEMQMQTQNQITLMSNDYMPPDHDHEQVSRTTSDTLGQEFAEYVTEPTTINAETLPGYSTRVEFALKLGYTERLVQSALARLGSDPTQNELLAELIKLGAQQSNKNDFANSGSCDEGNGRVKGGALASDGHRQGLDGCGGDNASHTEDLSLRPIVIDGSNLAMSHGNKEIFSCRGIKLCVDWFKNRGHRDITVFVPKWRKESSRPDNPVMDQEILNDLERERLLVFTPSRLVGGKRMVCYDDRYILKLAAENDGIVVSNDNYRDLLAESLEFKKVIEERILMYSFVNDRFMPPDDPLGRSGPTLDNFLRIQPKKGDPPPTCPYGKKCTYGNKCKFYHPERGLGPHKSVTERLSEHAARHLSARNSCNEPTRMPIQGKSLSVPLSSGIPGANVDYSHNFNEPRLGGRKALCRSKSGVPDGSQLMSHHMHHHQPPQQQQQLHHPMWSAPPQTLPTYQPLDTSSDGNFPKSHSIENLPRDVLAHGYGPQGPSMASASMGSLAMQSRLQKQSTEPSDEPKNLHRKLQRQLTLNPSGCDPRILEMQRCVLVTDTAESALVPPPQHSHSSPHRPLGESLSGPRNFAMQQGGWNLHQSVTRIASAPDQMRPSNGGDQPASSSEPQINLWPGAHFNQNSLATQDQRRRLHYHLASIFPEEQVQTVMQMYPDETNPQTICAAILSMFSKV